MNQGLSTSPTSVALPAYLYFNINENISYCQSCLEKYARLSFRSLTRSKTVVYYFLQCRTLPRSAPQLPLIPGYPTCCRDREYQYGTLLPGGCPSAPGDDRRDCPAFRERDPRKGDHLRGREGELRIRTQGHREERGPCPAHAQCVCGRLWDLYRAEVYRGKDKRDSCGTGTPVIDGPEGQYRNSGCHELSERDCGGDRRGKGRLCPGTEGEPAVVL